MLNLAIVIGARCRRCWCWRRSGSRRVSTPADASDAQLGQTLSTSGMSRKILLAIVAPGAGLPCSSVAYGANEPFRHPRR